MKRYLHKQKRRHLLKKMGRNLNKILNIIYLKSFQQITAVQHEILPLPTLLDRYIIYMHVFDILY